MYKRKLTGQALPTTESRAVECTCNSRYTCYYTVYDTHYIVYDIHYIVYDTHYIVYDIHYIVYATHYIVYDTHYIVYDTHNIVYDTHYIVYDITYIHVHRYRMTCMYCAHTISYPPILHFTLYIPAASE